MSITLVVYECEENCTYWAFRKFINQFCLFLPVLLLIPEFSTVLLQFHPQTVSSNIPAYMKKKENKHAGGALVFLRPAGFLKEVTIRSLAMLITGLDTAPAGTTEQSLLLWERQVSRRLRRVQLMSKSKRLVSQKVLYLPLLVVQSNDIVLVWTCLRWGTSQIWIHTPANAINNVFYSIFVWNHLIDKKVKSYELVSGGVELD